MPITEPGFQNLSYDSVTGPSRGWARLTGSLRPRMGFSIFPNFLHSGQPNPHIPGTSICMGLGSGPVLTSTPSDSYEQAGSGHTDFQNKSVNTSAFIKSQNQINRSTQRRLTENPHNPLIHFLSVSPMFLCKY